MVRFGKIDYLDTPQFQAAVLPYGTGRVSLAVFLPKPAVAAETLALSLTGKTAAHWRGAARPTEIELYLPRFKADTRLRLKAPLSSLGMGLAFDDAADFSRIGSRRTKLGEVLHAATLDVNEQGTTAAAATAVVTAAGAMRTNQPPPPVMRVDRPFLVLIRDAQTGSLLFAGIIRDPQ